MLRQRSLLEEWNNFGVASSTRSTSFSPTQPASPSISKQYVVQENMNKHPSSSQTTHLPTHLPTTHFLEIENCTVCAPRPRRLTTGLHQPRYLETCFNDVTDDESKDSDLDGYSTDSQKPISHSSSQSSFSGENEDIDEIEEMEPSFRQDIDISMLPARAENPLPLDYRFQQVDANPIINYYSGHYCDEETNDILIWNRLSNSNVPHHHPRSYN